MLYTNSVIQKALEVQLQSEEVNYTQGDTTVNNPREVNQNGGGSPHHYNKIMGVSKHCSLITFSINGFNSSWKGTD